MTGVLVRILRYVDDAQPGWVECQMTDVHGRTWSFVEKVPIVTNVPLDGDSEYPQFGVIGCTVNQQIGSVAWVDTTHPCGIESVDGETRFEVSTTCLVEW